ncbi:YciI family protein [Microbacterium sp. CFBP9034]|uniref:YciI family protein n=1 Tax=Microbacterium sp. CFBP9034 TaxID=3096540 RepID=UPI002A6A40E7|nr:YciI family protein [Microbacterium sp. CFBP9034]MDY0911014.1 YciI family protein [Microbacterium sp. CFBP9034]
MTTQQFLVLHLTDSSGSRLDAGEDRRMLEAWEEEGVEAGTVGSGSTVAGPDRAKSVVVRDGRTIVTDGPFPEFKEWFAGYDLVEAESIEEAAAYMAKHPTAVLGRVLILPTVALSWESAD